MRLLVILAVAAMTLSAADKPAKKQQAKPEPKAIQIPAGAVQSEPGVYHYTDAQGKKWIYRTTPFGVARLEDKPPAQADRVDPFKEEVKATEDGDTIHFERPGPFGTYKWQRKKSELTDSEKAIWERAQAKATGKQD
ncbi:MAG TPA: hypothetical protein VG675_12685 [Bryobacteraceae bacterium]|nr:hypothetical protein [Bryobacteraceae bacterium]